MSGGGGGGGGGEEESHIDNVGSDMTQAFQELAKGEKTASVLESRLTDIESRIDQLLASIEEKDNNGHDSPTDKRAEGKIMIPPRK